MLGLHARRPGTTIASGTRFTWRELFEFHSSLRQPDSTPGNPTEKQGVPMMLEKLERATGDTPRVIDRNTHAALDYLTVGAFMLMGGYFWGRNKRATSVALINGLMVLGVSMFTDYRGSLRRLISFRQHGELDIVQAMTAAGLPLLLGLGGTGLP